MIGDFVWCCLLFEGNSDFPGTMIYRIEDYGGPHTVTLQNS
jgi:hypothetical protein